MLLYMSTHLSLNMEGQGAREMSTKSTIRLMFTKTPSCYKCQFLGFRVQNHSRHVMIQTLNSTSSTLELGTAMVNTTLIQIQAFQVLFRSPTKHRGIPMPIQLRSELISTLHCATTAFEARVADFDA